MGANTAKGRPNADCALHVHTASWSDTARNATHAPTASWREPARNATHAPTANLLWVADSAVGAHIGLPAAIAESAESPEESLHKNCHSALGSSRWTMKCRPFTRNRNSLGNRKGMVVLFCCRRMCWCRVSFLIMVLHGQLVLRPGIARLAPF